MKASNIKQWISYFSADEWPAGALDEMDADLFNDCVFPLRNLSGVPMWPSSLLAAHVRPNGTSRHSTQGGTRLSYATDLHVNSIGRMIKVMNFAESIPAIGGIGIYFNTNTPMVHIDKRPNRLVWLCYENEQGETIYLYRENDAVKFYKKLGELL